MEAMAAATMVRVTKAAIAVTATVAAEPLAAATDMVVLVAAVQAAATIRHVVPMVRSTWSQRVVVATCLTSGAMVQPRSIKLV